MCHMLSSYGVRVPMAPVLDVPLTEQAKYLAVWLAYDALSIWEILWGLQS